MKNLILGILMAFVGFTMQSQDIQPNKNAQYSFEVKGNCEQCQKRIQKAAMSVKGVKSAVWDVDAQKINLILNEEKCNVQDVKKAIAKSGHDTDEIKATQEDYNNLHHCCQYDRK